MAVQAVLSFKAPWWLVGEDKLDTYIYWEFIDGRYIF